MANRPELLSDPGQGKRQATIVKGCQLHTFMNPNKTFLLNELLLDLTLLKA